MCGCGCAWGIAFAFERVSMPGWYWRIVCPSVCASVARCELSLFVSTFHRCRILGLVGGMLPLPQPMINESRCAHVDFYVPPHLPFLTPKTCTNAHIFCASAALDESRRSWSGEITAAELAKSRFFEVTEGIAQEDDINMVRGRLRTASSPTSSPAHAAPTLTLFFSCFSKSLCLLTAGLTT